MRSNRIFIDMYVLTDMKLSKQPQPRRLRPLDATV